MDKPQHHGSGLDLPEHSILLAPNDKLFIPYALPYGVFVLSGTLLSRLPPEIDYTVRIVAVSILLFIFRKRYAPLRGTGNPLISCSVGIIAGLLGTILWIALLAPFLRTPVAPWSHGAFALRFVAATLLVPFFEEMLMRVYVFRFAHQWAETRKTHPSDALDIVLTRRDITAFAPGTWSFTAVALSTAAFALGHHTAEWPAAVAYGLLMAFLWILRKDVLTCVVAHGVTNAALGVYVMITGNWQFW